MPPQRPSQTGNVFSFLLQMTVIRDFGIILAPE